MAKEQKSDVDKILAEKLQKKQEKITIPTTRTRRASGTAIFDIAEQTLKTKTEIIEKKTRENAEKTIYWSKPYDIYGRKLRKEGAGFEESYVLNYFIKLDSIVEDSKSRNFKDCIDRHIQDCQNEEIIKESYKRGLISSGEKKLEIRKIAEKREAFLHYTAITYLGFFIARYNALKDNPEVSDKGRKAMKKEITTMRKMTMEMAKTSFCKHNHHLDQKITKQMCEAKGIAYNIFKKTIHDLTILFANYFKKIPDETRISHYQKMKGNTIQTVLSQLEYMLDLPHLISTVPAKYRIKSEVMSANYQKEPTATD